MAGTTRVVEFQPCPQCAAEGRGEVRIGARKTSCATCNRYAQRVRRLTYLYLKARVGEAFERLHEQARRDAYAELDGGPR